MGPPPSLLLVLLIGMPLKHDCYLLFNWSDIFVFTHSTGVMLDTLVMQLMAAIVTVSL